ncbi:ATP-binding cassette domain-containing protein [Lapidilactobacillus wuchangensis]|uniref:ATP-binding cassette domain-containing protein n=1 Tax=Lapidilactobacillus wuchangensis TaxID=2486001 RepID=UPI000F76FA7F|nr:ABC transporter ATP-binding protein [Lapidilactobacillus wuchangensis]
MVKIFQDSILNRFAKHSQVALAMVSFILKAGALILTAQYFGNLLGAISSQSWSKFAYNALGLFLSYAALTAVSIVCAMLKNKIIFDINTATKMKYIDSALDSKTATQEIDQHVSYLTGDMKLFEENGISNELTIVEDFFQFILAFAYGLSLDWLTTSIFLLGAFAPIIVGNTQTKKLGEASEKFSDTNKNYLSIVRNTLLGKDTLWIYQALTGSKKRVKESLGAMETSVQKMNNRIQITNELSILAFIVFGVILPISVGGYRVISGHLSLALFFVIFQLNGSISNPLVEMISCFNGIKTVDKIKQNLLGLKAPEQSVIDDDQPVDVAEFSLRRVSIAAGDKILMKNLNLDVNSGDKVLIQAPSGYGKTTLLDVLWGKNKIHGGEYLINHQDVDDMQNQMLGFSLVRQKPLIFDDTIYFNITLGHEYTDAEFDEALRKACLTELVAEKSRDYVVGENGEHLSGGQLQRIEIARAIIRQRPVILADEPTSALDAVLSQQIQESLATSSSILIEVAHKLSDDETKLFTKVVNLEED